MDAESLKALLSGPVALFVIMLLASLANGLKGLLSARQQGSDADAKSLLASPLDIVYSFITNSLAFVALIMTDTLNFASAVGIGYVANSVVALLNPRGSAAAASMSTTGPEPKGS